MPRPARMADCHPDRKHDSYGLCGPCRAAKGRAEKPTYFQLYYRANYDFVRASMRRSIMKAKYGITPEQYDSMLEAQGGVCAICQRPESAIHQNGKVMRLAIDHVEGSDPVIVRGLLCASCNQAIGRFDHDPEQLRRAIAYLAPHLRKVV